MILYWFGMLLWIALWKMGEEIRHKLVMDYCENDDGVR